MRGFAQAQLGVGAGDGAGDVDAVAVGERSGAIAEGLDASGAIGSGRVGERREAQVFAGADVGIHGVDAGGVEAHEDLAGGGTRLRDFRDAQNFRSAELLNADRFHRRLFFDTTAGVDNSFAP